MDAPVVNVYISAWFPDGRWKNIATLRTDQTIEELVHVLRNSSSESFRIVDKTMKEKKANALIWNGKGAKE